MGNEVAIKPKRLSLDLKQCAALMLFHGTLRLA